MVGIGDNQLLEGGIILLIIAAIAIIIKIGWILSLRRQKRRLTEKKIEEMAEEGVKNRK